MAASLGFVPTIPKVPATVLSPPQAAASEGAESGVFGPMPTIPISGTQPLFAGSSGPPLILAFLAVGLLLGAFAALFTVRCVTPGYRARLQAEREAMWWSEAEIPLGEPPKLWDVYVDPNQSLHKERIAHSGSWSSMMPIAVNFVPDINEPPSQPNIPPLPVMTIVRQEPAFKRFLNAIRQYYFPNPHRFPSPPSIPPPLKPPTLDSTEAPVVGELQVAMAIAMPRRPPASMIHSKSFHGGAMEEQIISDPDSIPEFCLGIATTRSDW